MGSGLRSLGLGLLVFGAGCFPVFCWSPPQSFPAVAPAGNADLSSAAILSVAPDVIVDAGAPLCSDGGCLDCPAGTNLCAWAAKLCCPAGTTCTLQGCAVCPPDHPFNCAGECVLPDGGCQSETTGGVFCPPELSQFCEEPAALSPSCCPTDSACQSPFLCASCRANEIACSGDPDAGMPPLCCPEGSVCGSCPAGEACGCCPPEHPQFCAGRCYDNDCLCGGSGCHGPLL